MVVYSYVYGLWAVFIFLESVTISRLKDKGLEPVRSFMIFCVFRDLLLLCSASTQWYWDIGWVGKEIELVWLAGIAGFLVHPGRAWRLPAATLAAVFLIVLARNGWPFQILQAADMHILQRMACVIIIGTLLIGMFSAAKNLALLGSVVVLAGSDMVSAQTYLAGDFSPRLAAAIWVAGLCILVTAAKASAGLIQRQTAGTPAGRASNNNSQTCQRSARPSEATPQGDFLRKWELSEMPCHNRLQ